MKLIVKRIKSTIKDWKKVIKMYNPTYLKAVLIYVKDKETGYIHIVGTNQHDRLYLDDDGNIQYMNLQNY